MSYTEQDVERVAEAIKRQKKRVLPRDMVGEFTRLEWEQARAALAAMEREPLEDVIDDLSPGTKISHVWPLREGGYEAAIGVPVTEHPDGWWDHEMFRGEGATIDAAIRNAVAAAQEER